MELINRGKIKLRWEIKGDGNYGESFINFDHLAKIIWDRRPFGVFHIMPKSHFNTSHAIRYEKNLSNKKRLIRLFNIFLAKMMSLNFWWAKLRLKWKGKWETTVCLKFYDGTQFCHLIVKYITRDDDRWKRFGLNKRDNDLLPTTKKLILSHDWNNSETWNKFLIGQHTEVIKNSANRTLGRNRIRVWTKSSFGKMKDFNLMIK